jgi:hypothetical protein
VPDTVGHCSVILIKIIDIINKDKQVKTWVKRLILVCSILSTGVLYWAIGKDTELIINSAILAPVAWSWIFKPICAKLGIDYKKIDNTINK